MKRKGYINEEERVYQWRREDFFLMLWVSEGNVLSQLSVQIFNSPEKSYTSFSCNNFKVHSYLRKRWEMSFPDEAKKREVQIHDSHYMFSKRSHRGWECTDETYIIAALSFSLEEWQLRCTEVVARFGQIFLTFITFHLCHHIIFWAPSPSSVNPAAVSLH